MSDHFRRMIELADQFFQVKNDPSQLEVTPEVIKQLKNLHPSTVSEKTEGDGPVCWILIIPSSSRTMNQFLNGDITETDIFKQSLCETDFEALYLCSALVLPEFRRKGIAKQMTLNAISSFKTSFNIKFLYSWPFSEEGKLALSKIEEESKLPVIFFES